MENPIVLTWREENGDWKVKLVDREKFVNLISSIRDGCTDNNVVSTKLSEILPEMVMIRIDKKRNAENPESPMIECFTHEKVKMIKIPNIHTIMWGIFNEYTK